MNSARAALLRPAKTMSSSRRAIPNCPRGTYHPCSSRFSQLLGRRIFNYCEEAGKTFATGGRLDASTLKGIAASLESDWKHYADCAIVETMRSMIDTHKAFHLIVVKYKRQAELFDDQAKYHVIARNLQKTH